ncbi:class F sortase [Streptomyces boninensis]|uniref:class F sortase n=1 Tax=Streptomyces boninensis TaxID=2039455 RepID=UPI003B21CF0F
MRVSKGARVLVAAATALAAAAASLLVAGLLQRDPPTPRPPHTDATSAPAASPPGTAGHHHPDDGDSPTRKPPNARPLPASAPARLSIPSLGVASDLERLGRDGDGAMQTPADHRRAGWYTPGPTPGELGPAVIAGHVTWNGTRSVFYRLGDLRPGDLITVERADGRTARFEVQRTERYAKSDFPTVEVYRNLDHAGLRLITCGGAFDEANHYYADNIVVFAALTNEA